MNAISQDSIFSAADRTRGGRFERRAYRYRQEERPLTTEVCHQVRGGDLQDGTEVCVH